jgi:hypothetical protein
MSALVRISALSLAVGLAQPVHAQGEPEIIATLPAPPQAIAATFQGRPA